MTPEELRRIFDPEQRRKGFEAWKREAALQPKLETRATADGRTEAVVTRKTLRKDT